MLVSVLIRNLNEATSLSATLLSVRKQVADFEFEIVVVDNESDDHSQAVASEAGCRVFQLPRKDFSFGRALNFGIRQCRGSYILILSAHILLVNEYFIKKIPTFFEDTEVAALRFVLATAPQKVEESIVSGPIRLVNRPGELNFASEKWSELIVNHCSAIRRSCWEIQHFDEEIFSSEDKLWSLEIMKKGYAILCNVPCFYVYIRALNREGKIRKLVIDAAAKEQITGKMEMQFRRSWGTVFWEELKAAAIRVRARVFIHRKVSKALKAFRKKNQ